MFLPPSGLSLVFGGTSIVPLPSSLSMVSGKPPVVRLPSGLAVIYLEKHWLCACHLVWQYLWKRLGMALASSTVGGVILLSITDSWDACIRVLCVDTAAEKGCSLSTGCSCPIVSATVTVEPPSFDASPTITV